jgi:hypothetical protein
LLESNQLPFDYQLNQNIIEFNNYSQMLYQMS